MERAKGSSWTPQRGREGTSVRESAVPGKDGRGQARGRRKRRKRNEKSEGEVQCCENRVWRGLGGEGLE